MRVFATPRKPPRNNGVRPVKRVAFIGAGNIASVHAEAIARRADARLVAVVDPRQDVATRFAAGHGASRSYATVEEALAAQVADVFHILTPPPTHAALATQILEAGHDVVVEKPLAETGDEASALVRLAAEKDAALHTNQNFVWHPTHRQLRQRLGGYGIGPHRAITCHYVMPLRQLAARQFGHWMFDSPRNLLLEQAVHPLSQLDDIAGPLEVADVHAGPVTDFGGGVHLTTSWVIRFASAACPVVMHFSLGASHPVWSVEVIGEDGTVRADYISGRVLDEKPGAYLEAAETLRGGLRAGMSATGQAMGGAARYLGSQAGLLKRNDPFFRSIRGSLDHFYDAISLGTGRPDGQRGARLVALCNEIAGPTTPRTVARAKVATAPASADVAVLGGTGFIGRAVVRQLLGQGKRVSVLARTVTGLPDLYFQSGVSLHQGSVGDAEAVASAIGAAPVVINLAHGGGGDSYEAIHKALVGSARIVADMAKEAGTEKLLYVSSIAALYLGDPDETITGATGPDPEPEKRGDYARAKAAAELEMMALARDGVPVSIFRPGIVVGEGTSPFHSGVGLYNREQVCLGWNNGDNPLPFVLVDDVAAALVRAALEVPASDLSGRSFNLVGDVRLSARVYTALLAHALRRPLSFRPQTVWAQQAGEIVKWGIKAVAGRGPGFPSPRDLNSRGMAAAFDTSTEKEVLGWSPVADRAEFIRQAMEVHRPAIDGKAS